MKRIFSLLLVLALTVGLCAAASAEAVTLTDQAGRTVTVEAEPRRIVSGYYIATSAIIALGLQDRMVGIEAKADRRAIYRLSAPALMELPNVGTAKEFDLEGCIALEPELVVLPLKLKNAAAVLEELGIPVVLVNPESQTLLEEMVTLLGTAAGAEAEAEALLAFLAEQQEMLNTVLDGAVRPKVYLAGNSSLMSTAGPAMFQSDVITLAGGENAAAEIGDSYWAEISYEQLLAWNPDCILLASDAVYTAEDVMADPNLQDCAAVQNGRVYRMPDTAEAWDSPVPAGVLGSVWLASVLHPDLLSEQTAEDIIENFYQTFYGFSYRAA